MAHSQRGKSEIRNIELVTTLSHKDNQYTCFKLMLDIDTRHVWQRERHNRYCGHRCYTDNLIEPSNRGNPLVRYEV